MRDITQRGGGNDRDNSGEGKMTAIDVRKIWHAATMRIRTADASRHQLRYGRTGAMLIQLAVVAFPSASRAQARDNYPVCLRVYSSMIDWYDECGYTSIAQCKATASGRSAECLVNPFFVGAPEKPRRHRRHRAD